MTNDLIRNGWAAWWNVSSPRQRRTLQAGHRLVSTREVAVVITDAAGVPDAIALVENENYGTICLPDYVVAWDPNTAAPDTDEAMA